jgi:hypothetical protein
MTCLHVHVQGEVGLKKLFVATRREVLKCQIFNDVRLLRCYLQFLLPSQEDLLQFFESELSKVECNLRDLLFDGLDLLVILAEWHFERTECKVIRIH